MIDVVIVNWNSGDQLKDCVDSVLNHDRGLVERIVVVDNGSSDGSFESIADCRKTEGVNCGENLGFGAACNVGAKMSSSPFILFLNPDTCLYPDSLSSPLNFLAAAENADVGICGIQLVDDSGAVSRSCARYPTLGRFASSSLGLNRLPCLSGTATRMSDWDHMTTTVVDQVIGAFFLIRRSLFDDLQGFDERFFVYYEEVDLALRAGREGFKSVYLSDVRAFHAGGGTSSQAKAMRLFYAMRSRILYGGKHFPRWQVWCLIGLTGVIEPVSRSISCMFRGDVSGIKHTWSACRMLWGGMPSILSGEGRFPP